MFKNKKTYTKHSLITKIALPFVAAATLAACASPSRDLPTVAQVDVQRYAGTWYEIARLPMPFQKQCAANVSAQYSLNPDNTITVLNRCQRTDGTWSQAEGLARPQNTTNSRLSVTFLPKALRWLPFGQSPYWVMALDDHYQYAMVGQPDRKYLWLLSRTPQMDEATYQKHLAQAKAQGYDVSQIIRTTHSQQEKP